MSPLPGFLQGVSGWHRWCWYARTPGLHRRLEVSSFLPVIVQEPVWLPMDDGVPF